MPTIDIPADYWTIENRGFSALVATVAPVVAAIDSELANQHDGVSGAAADDTQQQLDVLDGDAPQLAENAAQQTAAVVNTPTGDVVRALPGGDSLTSTADTSVYQAAQGAPSTAPAPSGGGSGDSGSPVF